VIGRRFDPGLLAVATTENGDIDARLAAMQALDLVRREARSSDYKFKHALVRDALYQSLLTEARQALHLKIAKETERRSGNRLAEVAEVLAHHYGQTDLADKAFAFLAMAGSKSLSVYSLDEARTHFTNALALLDKNQDCASDEQVAEFLVSYTLLLNMSSQVSAVIGLLERYAGRIARMGDDPRVVLALLACARSCREISEVASVGLKKQFRQQRRKAIKHVRIGTAFSCARCIYKSSRAEKNCLS
jgi:predicted ATPase